MYKSTCICLMFITRAGSIEVSRYFLSRFWRTTILAQRRPIPTETSLEKKNHLWLNFPSHSVFISFEHCLCLSLYQLFSPCMFISEFERRVLCISYKSNYLLKASVSTNVISTTRTHTSSICFNSISTRKKLQVGVRLFNTLYNVA